MTGTLRDFSKPVMDLNGKSVLVTGGTGSFGKAITRYILERFAVRRLVVFSRDELKQFEMERSLPVAKHPALRYFIGDVRDQGRLTSAMRGIDYVIHAAAMKQVPTAEYNPFECIRTNVIGAENVVQAAMEAGVQKVLALSTDKAANPINLYGASKLASDKIFVAANNVSGFGGTRFAVVRYGNVIGSRGSVVELFGTLLREGAREIPITDPRMTRFWITLNQGVGFVLSSMEMMQGGELFVPKIPSMRIADLAASMAPGLPHRAIGIRPGEKLHEVLISEDDARLTLELDDRFIVQPAFPFWRAEPYQRSGAHPVPEGFSYTSDRNTEWLSAEALQQLIALGTPGA
ncbi:UDP-N-acetylglucosamine 4,6-dehydratase (inverting) [Azospirillum sp. SYSU D00513]|uniref:UDP-N-acetylglucosamine 4,6-dehydratase (inverting) n=1 Tax=Azospirillum sp. SYSU D00513 TaxID=2812561 RepID=UPI001FFFB31D|nr:UDP-N-acetylglucosamine 4,6-dehydratase (inverting) [Azospirillum sp. SYSU D00513]